MSSTDSSDTTTGVTDAETEDPDLKYPWRNPPDRTFDDVGGHETKKNILNRTVVHPLHGDHKRYEQLGVPIPNILFSGPPGTGKTYLAKALAGEAMVPWVELTGAAIQSKWINESSELVNQLFGEAAAISKNHGYTIIFLDEIDTILPARGGHHHAEDEKVVNEFLRFLERSHDQKTLVIGATNRPDQLDPAAVREGRFDRHLKFGFPDTPTRKAILEQQLSDRPNQVSNKQLIKIASQTDGWTAATLEQLIIEAARETIHDGKSIIMPRHLDTALSILNKENRSADC